MAGGKRPESVLVVIHDVSGLVLLLERAQHPGYWQSVTGSLEDGEAPRAAAARETFEETGLRCPPSAFRDWRLSNRFEIFAEWRDRYPAGVTHNLEHVFSLCLPRPSAIRLSPDEHRAYRWLAWRAAAAACFSWSNRDAILMLGLSQGAVPRGSADIGSP
ncbi:MAG: dihydroneopterin triphosphate diphosphatase [Rhodocyclaceae bacterium]|nr:dihydroneopterin triphosphate diphosphatase [Rhodocyclaceae bacterium]